MVHQARRSRSTSAMIAADAANIRAMADADANYVAGVIDTRGAFLIRLNQTGHESARLVLYGPAGQLLKDLLPGLYASGSGTACYLDGKARLLALSERVGPSLRWADRIQEMHAISNLIQGPAYTPRKKRRRTKA